MLTLSYSQRDKMHQTTVVFVFLNHGVATQEAKIFDVDRYTMSKLCDDDNDDNTYIGKGRLERLGQVPYTIFVTKSALEHLELN